MKTVKDWWDTFEERVLPKGCHPIQRQETRRAFYAGFLASLLAGIEMADESGDDDDLGARMIQSLHEECQAFKDAVGRGEA